MPDPNLCAAIVDGAGDSAKALPSPKRVWSVLQVLSFITKPPRTTKQESVQYIANKISAYFKGVNRIWEEKDRMERTGIDSVPDYLPAGKRIDWTYPD